MNRSTEPHEMHENERLSLSRGQDPTAASAASITCAGVQPRARSSLMPVSLSDLLNFCEGDFMING